MNEDRLAVDDDEEQAPVDADRERGYQIGRLMAFSDGVFAIAITLLVLNVAVPDIAQSDAQSRLPAALLQTGPRLLTFALSFFLVGFYWILHHQLFRQLTSVNVWLLWLNLVVLFLVSLLPFSSGVVGRYYDTVIGA
ncbi:MAG: TMEM175 family protein, partial [Candidatus Dormibacteraeota bacterium]|nr:TMEM175 family protein [Candidatus Dormibacteraeota bacterium]